VRFAALVHDLGKGVTPPADWPSHIGHDYAGVRSLTPVRSPQVPNSIANWASWRPASPAVHRALELRDKTVLELLTATDAFRRPDRFEKLLLACEADARGRGPGLRARPYVQGQLLRRWWRAAADVKLDPAFLQQHAGPAIAEHLRAARIEAIRSARAREQRHVKCRFVTWPLSA
jgi:tRNA nucleotidyltransferase (CCA-adding enzyme)